MDDFGSPEIDMQAVVDELRRRGVHSYVEQTGGGVATIYAGPQHEEEGWGARWACLAGPGWFEGPGSTLPRANLYDLYVGPDDSGESDPIAVTPAYTVAMVADTIETVIRRGDDAWKFVHDVAALTKDGEKLDNEGRSWEMENDDAWSTVHSLIGDARAILGVEDPPQVDDDDPDDSMFGHCDTCGAPCGPDGCSADSRHPVALSHDDQQPRMTNKEQT